MQSLMGNVNYVAIMVPQWTKGGNKIWSIGVVVFLIQ